MTGLYSQPSTDDDFSLVLLGGFNLFWRSRVLYVPRASQRLLALLAFHGRMVERAAVAGTLWPDASERQAHSSLRSTIARLQNTARKALAASKFELGLAEGVTVSRWGEAADAAGAVVRAEPLRESGHAALIQVHLAEGNQWGAVREFTRYEALLRAELGLAPTCRLRQLVDGLQRS